MSDQFVTTTNLIAAATEYLQRGGYSLVEDGRRGEWPTSNVRVFEDPYGVVAVVVYETWSELVMGWTEAQGALVHLISENIGRSEAKAWDGYLVLLTPSLLSAENRLRADEIRRDTTRVRKLLGTGEELRNPTDAERLLSPLLPLSEELEPIEQGSTLNLLPGLLSARGVSGDAVRVLVDAFREQAPLMDRLHGLLNRHED